MFLDPHPIMPLVPFLDVVMVVLTPSCMVDVCVCSVKVAMCACVSVDSFTVPHCMVEVAMCAGVSVASFTLIGSCSDGDWVLLKLSHC